MLREPPLEITDDDAGGDARPPVTEVLRAALGPLAARIDAAFIYGPAARGAAAHGEIDVLIIGRDITYADVLPHIITAAKFIGRAINPSVYNADEWLGKLARGSRIALAVLKQRRILVLGTEEGIPRPR
jgi:hypothetical protein